MINRSTVVGVFDDRSQAERAVEGLRRLGYLDNQIGFAARAEQPEDTRAVGEGAKQTGEGAAAGAVSGGLIGGLIGAAISGLIPGIGPIIAGGILASVLGGAAVGATAGGLYGALVGEGVPEEEARYYDEAFRAGRTIVTVRAGDRYDEAQSALRRYGAYDVHSRDQGAAGVGTNPGHSNTTAIGDRDRMELSDESRLDTSADAEPLDEPSSIGAFTEHAHVYDENGWCVTCGRSRRDIEGQRRAA